MSCYLAHCYVLGHDTRKQIWHSDMPQLSKIERNISWNWVALCTSSIWIILNKFNLNHGLYFKAKNHNRFHMKNGKIHLPMRSFETGMLGNSFIKSETVICPNTTALRVRKRRPCRGFVKKSATILMVLQYWIDTRYLCKEIPCVNVSCSFPARHSSV